MTAADTAAVKALAESAGATLNAFQGHVYVTLVPDRLAVWAGGASGYPYIIMHPADGTDEATRLTGPTTTTHPEYTFHVTGLTASSVQAAVAQLKAKCQPASFIIAPTVANRKNYGAYWRSPTTIQTDRDVTPWLVYQVIEYGWTSDPA